NALHRAASRVETTCGRRLKTPRSSARSAITNALKTIQFKRQSALQKFNEQHYLIMERLLRVRLLHNCRKVSLVARRGFGRSRSLLNTRRLLKLGKTPQYDAADNRQAVLAAMIDRVLRRVPIAIIRAI